MTRSRNTTAVMAGLVPAIHVFVPSKWQGVDARDKSGHDEGDRTKPNYHPPHPASLCEATLSRKGRG
jgi:hypothetical protein